MTILNAAQEAARYETSEKDKQTLTDEINTSFA